MSNNPTLDVLTEIMEYRLQKEQKVVETILKLAI